MQKDDKRDWVFEIYSCFALKRGRARRADAETQASPEYTIFQMPDN